MDVSYQSRAQIPVNVGGQIPAYYDGFPPLTILSEYSVQQQQQKIIIMHHNPHA